MTHRHTLCSPQIHRLFSSLTKYSKIIFKKVIIWCVGGDGGGQCELKTRQPFPKDQQLIIIYFLTSIKTNQQSEVTLDSWTFTNIQTLEKCVILTFCCGFILLLFYKIH